MLLPTPPSPTNGAAKFGPTEPSIMNLLMIGTMKGPRRDFSCRHGFSDHQRGHMPSKRGVSS
jgi:hypothetical protein